MSILTLLKAALRYRKGSFVSVLVLTFIISLCLNTILSINKNVEERVETSLDLNNIGDLVIIIWDVNCPDSMLSKLKKNPNIDHMRVVKAVTQELKINEIKNGNSTFFMPYNQDNKTYKVFDNKGLSFVAKPKSLRSGEIYVPISFKQIYNSKPQDKAYLTVDNQKRSFTVAGFFEEPFMGSEMTGMKFGLMNEEDFNSLYEGRLLSKEEREGNETGIRGYYLIHLYKNENCKLTMSEVKRSLNENTGIMDFALYAISKDQSISYTLMLTQIILGIMLAFLVLLLMVMLIIIGHSINTGIEMDYTNLGVLKAIGFDKGRLRSVYVLEYTIAVLIGAALGFVFSIPALYYLNNIFVKMTGLLSSVKPAFITCVLILLLILLFSAFFVFMKTKVIARVSPVIAISGGKKSIYFRSRLEIPVEGRGLFLRMAYRQLTSNKKQYISATVISAILVYFLVSITLLNTSMDNRTIEESFGIAFSDIGVNYNSKSDEGIGDVKILQSQVEADISSISPIERSFRIEGNYFSINGDEYQCSIYYDPTMIKSILKGRAPLYDNEIVITEIVSNELGLKIGDTVTLGNGNIEEKFIVSGLFQCTNDMGRTISMSYEGAKKLIPNYTMNDVEYVLKDPEKSSQIVKVISEKYKDQIEAEDYHTQEDFGDTIISSIGILNVIIYSISILFAFVVILIVCSKIYLKERNDFGIYKALGFTSFMLRLQFSLRFALLALTGGLLGIILNISLNNTMMSVLLKNVGITRFITKYNFISLGLPMLVLTTCFFLFAFLVSGKIKGVDTKNLISLN